MVKPWYKQVWPWVLIAIPLATMLKAVHSVYLMNQQSPDLVVDDYYAEGKSINMNLARFREAEARNLKANILIAGNKAIVTFTASAILDAEVKLRFVHNTIAAQDFVVNAQRSGENLYVAELPSTLTGKWNLVVSDTTEQWKLRASFMLPSTSAISLKY